MKIRFVDLQKVFILSFCFEERGNRITTLPSNYRLCTYKTNEYTSFRILSYDQN